MELYKDECNFKKINKLHIGQLKTSVNGHNEHFDVLGSLLHLTPTVQDLMIDFAPHSAEELLSGLDESVLDRLIPALRNLKILRLAGLNRLNSE